MEVLHSWPLASDPAHLARLDNDDAALNTWAITWVAQALIDRLDREYVNYLRPLEKDGDVWLYEIIAWPR